MAKGHTICQFCGENVPSSYIRKHVILDHKDMIMPLSPSLRALKIIILTLTTFSLAYFSYNSPNPLVSGFLAFLWGAILVDLVINVKKLLRKYKQGISINRIGGKKIK